MGALQVWQALSEAQGRGHGDREVAILFTDLVDFSDWVLEAGDEQAVELVREVGKAVEGAVRAHGGRVVKRLGDGVMAVFDDPAAAVQAGCEAAARGRRAARRRACARACTSAARASSAATTSASTSTSPRASPRRPAAARCSSPTPSATGSTRRDRHAPALALQAQGRAEGPAGVRRRDVPGNAPGMRALLPGAILAGLLAVAAPASAADCPNAGGGHGARGRAPGAGLPRRPHHRGHADQRAHRPQRLGGPARAGHAEPDRRARAADRRLLPRHLDDQRHARLEPRQPVRDPAARTTGTASS